MMKPNYEDEIEIVDTDNYGLAKNEGYSHSTLVMTAIRKCLELGSKEMRTGWFNTKQDRQGNITQTYVDDTRKAFIESVKTLLMIVACDLDEEAEELIEDIKEAIKQKKEELIEAEAESWEELDATDKQVYMKEMMKPSKNKLTHPKSKNEMIEYEIEAYREIVSEVSRLTKRLDFYKAELIEA